MPFAPMSARACRRSGIGCLYHILVMAPKGMAEEEGGLAVAGRWGHSALIRCSCFCRPAAWISSIALSANFVSHMPAKTHGPLNWFQRSYKNLVANWDPPRTFSFSHAETNSRARALGLCDGLMSRSEMPVTQHADWPDCFCGFLTAANHEVPWTEHLPRP